MSRATPTLRSAKFSIDNSRCCCDQIVGIVEAEMKAGTAHPISDDIPTHGPHPGGRSRFRR